MNPRPLIAVLLFLAGVLTAAAAGETKTDDGKVAWRVWPVPSDFTTRGDDQSDPFAGGDETRRPSNHPRYPHVIPVLGPGFPFDVRPILENLGVTFREGDVALFSNSPNTSLLFVRAHPDQVDLVDTLVGQVMGSNPAPHALVTWQLQRRPRNGPAELLLERTIVCQSGQRSRFQRHRGGREVEMEEVEATIGEDGILIDLNSAVKIRMEDRVITATGQALVRGDDPNPFLLLRTPDKIKGATLDLFVSAKRIRLPLSADGGDCAPETFRAGLADAINARVVAFQESGQRGEKQTGLSWAPELLHHAQLAPDASPSTGTLTGELLPAKLPDLGIDGLMDARPLLRRLKVPLADDEQAWWSPHSGLLWLDAREVAFAGVAAFSSDQWWLEGRVNQFEITFQSSQESARRRDFAPRSVLVRAGQQSAVTNAFQRGGEEKTEVEAWGSDPPEPITDMNLALTAWRMGGETWTLTAQARVRSDGTGPVPLASGMAKDSGGRRKTLTVSSRLRLHRWLELVSSPERKAAAIEAIAALVPKSQR